MGGLSWWHWLIIAAAFILLFGAKRLPDAARGVGRSLRILKSEVSAMNEDQNTDQNLPANQTAENPGQLNPALAQASAKPADGHSQVSDDHPRDGATASSMLAPRASINSEV